MSSRAWKQRGKRGPKLIPSFFGGFMILIGYEYFKNVKFHHRMQENDVKIVKFKYMAGVE